MAEPRYRNFNFLIYPDSAPDNWLDMMSDLQVTVGISPIHNKDVMPDGTLKKPHYHCIFQFDGPKSINQVKEILKPFNCPIPLVCLSIRGSARYFWHLDNPEKYQYRDPPTCFGGFDFYEIISLPSDDLKLFDEIRQHIQSNNIIHFCDLFDDCLDNHLDWARFLYKHPILVKEYMRSIEYKLTCVNRVKVEDIVFGIQEQVIHINDKINKLSEEFKNE